MGSDAHQGLDGSQLPAEGRLVVTVLGVALLVVATLLFVYSPQLSLENWRGVPLYPSVLAALSVSVFLFGVVARWAVWVGRSLLLLVVAVCAAAWMPGLPKVHASLKLIEGPLAADGALLFLVAGSVLFLASVRLRAAVLLSEIVSLTAVCGLSVLLVDYAFTESTTQASFAVVAFSVVATHLLAVSALWSIAGKRGCFPSPVQSYRILVMGASWIPIMALFFALGNVLSGHPLVLAATFVAPIAVFGTAAIVAHASVERRLSATSQIHEQTTKDQLHSLSAAGIGTWRLEGGEVVMSAEAEEIAGPYPFVHSCDANRFDTWLAEGAGCIEVQNKQGLWVEVCTNREGDSQVGTVRDVHEAVADRIKSESQLETLEFLAERSPDVTYVFDLTRQEYTYMNRAMGDLVGRPGFVSTTLFRDTVHHDDRAALLEHLNSVAAAPTDEPHEAEFRARTPDGGYVWIKDRAGVLMRDEEGRPTHIHGTAGIVTEQKELSERLCALQERFERLADKSPGVIYQFSVRADGGVSLPYISEPCEALFGVTRQEFYRSPELALSRVHPEDKQGLMEAIETSRATLQDFDWLGRYVHEDGRTSWIHSRSRPSRLPDRTTLWDGFAIDVTEQKLLEDELRQAEDDLEQLLAVSQTVTYECWASAPYRLRHVSSNIRLLTGDDSDLLVGRELFDPESVALDDQDLFKLHSSQFVDHGRSTTEYRLKTASGGTVWVRDDVRLARSGSDEEVVLGTWTNISSEQMHKERALQSETRLRSLTSLVPGILFEIEVEKGQPPRFNFVSAGAMELLGLAPEEVKQDAESLFRLIDEVDGLCLIESLNDRKNVEFEWKGEARRVDGTSKRLELKAKSMMAQEESVTWFGTITTQAHHDVFTNAVVDPLSFRQSARVLVIAQDEAAALIRDELIGLEGVGVSYAANIGVGLEIAKRDRPAAIVLAELSGAAGIIEALRADDTLATTWLALIDPSGTVRPTRADVTLPSVKGLRESIASVQAPVQNVPM